MTVGIRVGVGGGGSVGAGVEVGKTSVAVAVGLGVWVTITKSDSSSESGVRVGGGPMVGLIIVGVSAGKNSSIGALHAKMANNGIKKNSIVLRGLFFTPQRYHLMCSYPTSLRRLFRIIILLFAYYWSLSGLNL